MNSAQKLPLQRSLSAIAQNGAQQAVSLLGKSLPASIVSINGAIAKIKFEVLSGYNLPEIEVPIAGSQYVREPLQAGDKGFLISCNSSVQAVSGMGENVADISDQANLSALIFVPIGNKNWKGVNGKMLVLTGLSDVMIRDDSHQVQLEDENASWNSLISQLNTILDDITVKVNAAASTYTGLVPPANFAHITSNTNPVKARS